MADEQNETDLLRERIRAALDERGLEPVPLAVDLERGRDFLTDFLKGRKKKLDSEFLGELALRLGFSSADHLKRGVKTDPTTQSADDLVEAKVVQRGTAHITRPSVGVATIPVVPPIKDISRRIPIVGDVEAGVWRETVARESYDIEDYLPLDVQGYEGANLKAMRVLGPSMNQHYPPGRFVVVADPNEAGLRNGDHVIVERRRGSMTEVTLKEYVEEPGGRIALWPRSDHPDFQAPYYLKPTDESDQDGVAVIGVVVADYRRRDRPRN